MSKNGSDVSKDITQALLAWREGDESALEDLMPLVQDELHTLAHRYMAGEGLGHVLQTTALINEAYLRLVDCRRVRWQSRAHFFAVSTQLMRRILVDVARATKEAETRCDVLQISLEDFAIVAQSRSPDVIALDDALKTLAAFDERKSKIVELRFFGGLSVEETAEVLGISAVTVMRDWALAKTWLFRELEKS